MAVEWHQKEEFFANQDGHVIRIQPMIIGPGYSASMSHLSNDGIVEQVLIPARNEDGDWATGAPFASIEDAKAEAERFLVDHLATPLEERETRLLAAMMKKD